LTISQNFPIIKNSTSLRKPQKQAAKSFQNFSQKPPDFNEIFCSDPTKPKDENHTNISMAFSN
jgi:hypothetical protein